MNGNDAILEVAASGKSSEATTEDKAQWVKRFGESGLSLREFSAQHGLCYVSLWRWVNKAREPAAAVEGPALTFTEIPLPPVTEPGRWVAEWSMPNGAVLRLSKDVPAALVEQLLRVC